jgi:hypothetical protein
MPYIPPLATYHVQARVSDVRRGTPTIFPEDLEASER